MRANNFSRLFLHVSLFWRTGFEYAFAFRITRQAFIAILVETHTCYIYFLSLKSNSQGLLWQMDHSVGSESDHRIAIHWLIKRRHLIPDPELARTDLGWGVLSQFPPFLHFLKFSSLSKRTLDLEYHIYIWQVSPQLSCGDTCQIEMWFK